MNVKVLFTASLLLASFAPLAPTQAPPAAPAAAKTAQILPQPEAEKLLPPAILFKSQLAPVQARNSGVLRLPGGALVVASLVDNSGYSSGVRERFQFFLYTEVPLQLAPGKSITPGFYGAGFLADNTMIVLDVASHELFSVPTLSDPGLKRPRPLEMLADAATGENRLYLGRSYIVLKPGN